MLLVAALANFNFRILQDFSASARGAEMPKIQEFG